MLTFNQLNQLTQSYNNNNAPSSVYSALSVAHSEMPKTANKRTFIPPVNSSSRTADQDFFEGSPELCASLEGHGETPGSMDREARYPQEKRSEPRPDAPLSAGRERFRGDCGHNQAAPAPAQQPRLNQMLAELHDSLQDLRKEFGQPGTRRNTSDASRGTQDGAKKQFRGDPSNKFAQGTASPTR